MAKKGRSKGKSGDDVEEIKVILIGVSGVGKTNLINNSLGQALQNIEESTFYSVLNFEIEGKKYMQIYGILQVKKNNLKLLNYSLKVQEL